MPFRKLDENINKGGRPKGSTNKTSDEIRQWILHFLDKNVDDLQSDFDQMFPKDRLLFIEKMIRLVLPAPVSELERLDDASLQKLIDKLTNIQNQ